MMESCNSIIIWACNFGKIVMRPAQNAWNHRDKTIVALFYMPIEGAVLTFRFLCFIPIHSKPHVPSLSASFSSPLFHLLFLRLFHRLFCNLFPHTRNPANGAPGSSVGRASDSGSRNSGIKTRAGAPGTGVEFHLTSPIRRALCRRRPHFLQSGDPQFPGKGLIIII